MTQWSQNWKLAQSKILFKCRKDSTSTKQRTLRVAIVTTITAALLLLIMVSFLAAWTSVRYNERLTKLEGMKWIFVIIHILYIEGLSLSLHCSGHFKGGGVSKRASWIKNGRGERSNLVAQPHGHHGDGGRRDTGTRSRSQVCSQFFAISKKCIQRKKFLFSTNHSSLIQELKERLLHDRKEANDAGCWRLELATGERVRASC